ncbi:uncharacterized protein LOC126667404 isoform X1 [Mercurialis annua]|uniref:uncharacterized protein LOC126667404 isoform X1 n=1 Tax=Mercurialis annua TaxID=3986 RepID=UPI00215FD2AE|nr:uncharacterized protein LOC126667404 isoform X1 [Mercurialis annua]
MASGGASAGKFVGAGVLLLTKPGSLNIRRKHFLPLKSSAHYYFFQKLSYSCISRQNDSTVWSQRFKFSKNKSYRQSGGLDGEEEEESSERKRKKRRWWSDETPFMEEQEEEPPDILEEFIDDLWIIEVFKSYGWGLPLIIISWLIATGPKALLMTLAFPFGQLITTFVFKKLWGTARSKKPKRTAGKRRKRKPFVTSPSDVENEEQEQEMQEESVKGDNVKGFQSWVGNDDGSVNKGSKEEPCFGGWDELDRMEATQRPPRRDGQPRRRTSMNGKLGKRGSKNDVPLLLRLLISFFPFLGSWTKML